MKLPVFFSKCLKYNARSKTLMVNEAKRTPKTDFIVNTFALESEKELKYVERTLFCGSSQSLDLSLNPSGPKNAYMYFFWAILVLSIFWLLAVAFRVSSFTSALNLR